MADEKIIFSMNGVGKILPHNNRVILKDIYLSFFYGAKIGIVGLNGSGKSTLMKIIAGIEKGYQGTAADKAIRNALNTTSVTVLTANADNAAMIDTNFSDRVKTVGITDQKSSGRCWLFTGLNVLRAKMIVSHDLGTITSVVKSIVCVNRTAHRHDSNVLTEEQLRNYNCPIQLISHGNVPHTILSEHEHCPHCK